jgi:hypothetical protein
MKLTSGTKHWYVNSCTFYRVTSQLGRNFGDLLRSLLFFAKQISQILVDFFTNTSGHPDTWAIHKWNPSEDDRQSKNEKLARKSPSVVVNAAASTIERVQWLVVPEVASPRPRVERSGKDCFVAVDSHDRLTPDNFQIFVPVWQAWSRFHETVTAEIYGSSLKRKVFATVD